MDDATLGLIYSLKENGPNDEAAIEFYSEYSGTAAKWYNEEILMRIATNAMKDYILTADNPSSVLFTLFECMHFDCTRLKPIDMPFDERVRMAIWNTLCMSRVRNENGYVNGFRELINAD